jgi:sugar/nucleoside kinase (ribokinase family)
LRIAIASHIVLDKIKSADGTVTESIGGPPCYGGITSRRFGFDVGLVTKVGSDLPKELYNMLQNNGISLSDSVVVDAPTTKFQIVSQGNTRQLLLSDKCKPITIEDIQEMEVDCWLASPIIASRCTCCNKAEQRKKKFHHVRSTRLLATCRL